jgi:multidrug efflux pump subunit AcrB
MNLARFALRHPWTVLVAVVAVGLGAWIGLQRMTRDIFPPLGIPTIYVAQPYGGMDPLQMEGYLTYRYERKSIATMADCSHRVLPRGPRLPKRIRTAISPARRG